MTPLDALLLAGPALFGEWGWQRALARALDVDDRLVRRWIAGDREVPAWVPVRLLELARERSDAMRELVRTLR